MVYAKQISIVTTTRDILTEKVSIYKKTEIMHQCIYTYKIEIFERHNRDIQNRPHIV